MAGEPVLAREPLARGEVIRLTEENFGDMLKLVVDVERGILAAGGALHADAEPLLLANGSRQQDLWGANYFPDRKAGSRLEYTALINIRPRDGNASQRIQSESVRKKVLEIVARLVGEP